MKKMPDAYNEFMEIQKIVALNVAKARGEMSRKDLADKAGVSYQHIYEIEEELKKPSLKVLERVADALDIELYTLLKEQTEKPKLKPSTVFKLALNIPDDVYSLAEGLGPNHDIWKVVRGILETVSEGVGKETNIREQS